MRSTTLQALLAAVLLAGGVPARAERGPLIWSDEYALVLLDPGADLQAARRAVQAAGGTVALMLPPRVLTGWIPPWTDAELLGHAGISSIHRQALDAPPPGCDDVATRAALDFFARATRGELDGARPDEIAPAAPGKPAMLPDAFERDGLSNLDVEANLRARGLDLRAKAGGHLDLASNSDYMVGTVSVSLFFVESDGKGSDPDRFDWTPSAERDIYDQAVAGLSWWSSQARQHSNCWVAFYVQAFYATTDARCHQSLEPSLHPSTSYSGAVQQVLGNFGYTTGGHLSRAAAFDAAQRVANATDWAYSAFIAANPTGPTQFTDGYAAWAYIGGPYLALLQRSFNWPFRQVFAHESGHQFHSCDEYYVPGYGGCNDCGACADSGVLNGNCERCNAHAVSCMMRSNAWALCSFTAGQIGWWRDPCSAGALAPPQISSALPSQMQRGTSGQIELSGQSFTYGASVSFGAGVQVQSVQVLSPRRLRVELNVDVTAAPGARDVIVTALDQQSDTLAAAFRIGAMPRHYVSSRGAGIYPYDSPQNAATNLAAALAACGAGDTLLLTGGHYQGFEMDRSVVVLGGWTTDFTSCVPEALPSVIEAVGGGPVVTLSGAGGGIVLDGLVLRGGGGKPIAPSAIGPVLAGGGLFCYDTSPTLRRCVLEANTVGNSGAPGFGGGAFFWRSNPHLVGCIVRDNRAARGAGLFFLDCDARLDSNLVQSNLADGMAIPSQGGGIAALQSTLRLQNDVLRDNGGAKLGGGLHVESCRFVGLSGVRIEANVASGLGGGVAARATRLRLAGCELRRNTSAERGGGVHAVGDTLELRSTLLAANQTGILGGGVYADSCVVSLRNITLARNSGGPASGIFTANAPAAGEVRGCIVAQNTQGGIVQGDGAPLALDWNVYFENGGLDLLPVTPGAHDLSIDPGFLRADSLDFHLALHSACIDFGDADAAWRDPDGSRNDRGAYGGPEARAVAPPWVKGVQVYDLGATARLTWRPSTSRDIAGYAVYRLASTDLQPSATTFLAFVPGPSTAYIDTHPAAGEWYVVCGFDRLGHAGGYSTPAQASAPTDVGPGPHTLELRPIAPNPTNPGVSIDFVLPQSSPVRISVYSIQGRLVRRLVDGQQAAGPHRTYWNGRDQSGADASSGVYWVRLEVAHESQSRKLVLVR